MPQQGKEKVIESTRRSAQPIDSIDDVVGYWCCFDCFSESAVTKSRSKSGCFRALAETA